MSDNKTPTVIESGKKFTLPKAANSNSRKQAAQPGPPAELPATTALPLADESSLAAPKPPGVAARKRAPKAAKAEALAPPAPAQATESAPVPAARKGRVTSITSTGPGGARSRLAIDNRPAPSAAAQTRIFQIYYEPWHLELLDPAFEPFDNRGIVSEFYELEVFGRIAGSGEVKSAQLWGALSWRFGEKTGMTGQQLHDVIAANPGNDIYYCNPYPQNEALFHNMWLQGESCHPRFLEVAEAVCTAAGFPVEDLQAVEASEMFSAANYFVGTHKFWSLYLAFVSRAMGLSDSRMSKDMRELLHSPEADRRLKHNGATYVSFVVERLFPIFMKTSGRHLKKFKITLPERETEMNVHLRLLREMKDVAHKTRSAWLAACWVNYRNLYFSQSNGKEWCATHLRNVTPTTVRFG